MAFYQTVSAGTNLGTYSGATAYVVGDMVTTTALDVVSGSGLRFKAKGSTTGNAPTLDPADVNWALVHPANSLQALNAIAALLESADFNGSGNEWTRKYRLDAHSHPTAASRRFCLAYENLGLGNQDKVEILLAWQESTAVAATRLVRVGAAQGWLGVTGSQASQTLRTDVNNGSWLTGTAYVAGNVVISSSHYWVCVTNHTAATAPSVVTPEWRQLPNDLTGDLYAQTNTTQGFYAKMWNGGTGDIPLWFWANKARFMWVTQSDNRYHFTHAGLLFRFGTVTQLPLPLWVNGNSSSTTDAYDSSSDNNPPIAANTANMGLLFQSDAVWGDLSNTQRVMPYRQALIYGGRNAAGDYGLEEVLVYANPGGLQGRLDGVFYISPESLVSGNTVSVGGNDYVVFENVYRAQSGGFMALLKS